MAETSLSWYLQDSADLLRDSQYRFTTKKSLTRYINLARRQVAYRTSCLRFLISGQSPLGTSAQPGFAIPGAMVPGMLPDSLPSNTNAAGAASTSSNTFTTIPGVEMYPYKFSQPYLRAQYAGLDAVIDVIDVAVSWGGIRPVLNWMPWEDLQAYARSYNIGVTSYPFMWSTNGDGENANLWLFPCPVQGGVQGEMEWDVFCTPKSLNSDQDYDAIPHGFHHAVKYYACHLAYMASKSFGMASLMHDQFLDALGVGRAASDRGKTPDMYWAQSVP